VRVVCAERSPDKHDHVNPNEHPPMHDSSSVQDNDNSGNIQLYFTITSLHE